METEEAKTAVKHGSLPETLKVIMFSIKYKCFRRMYFTKHTPGGAMPDEDSVIVLMGKTAMDKESYNRVIPRIREDKTLFPDE